MEHEEKLKWHNEKRKVKDLILYDENPREMTEKQTEDLLKSLRKFDLVEIPAIDTNNVVCAGNQRTNLLMLENRGEEEIDVRVPNRKLTDEEFREYNLRSNKNTAQWNFDALANFGEDELLNVGFGKGELDEIFNLNINEDEFDAEEEYQKIKEPTTKLGEIYQLGNHRLMCGDAVKKEDVEKLMDGKLARLIFTDPPYNVDYKSLGGSDYSSKKYGGTGKKIFNDKKSDEDCEKFYSNVLQNLYAFSTDDVSIYWWYASKNDWLNRKSFDNAKWHISQDIIWLKNGMIFSRGQDYHRIYEPCMFGWKKGKSHYKNKKINNLVEVFSLDVNDFNNLLDVWYEKRDVTSKYVHPTQKPVRLAERALNKNSQRDDIVLDLFGGSGSTLLGCEQLNRKCYMMELDPKYCDVIIKRYKQFTGKEVIKL